MDFNMRTLRFGTLLAHQFRGVIKHETIDDDSLTSAYCASPPTFISSYRWCFWQATV